MYTQLAKIIIFISDTLAWIAIMEISFKNKTVLVTGGGNGIGRALCKALYKCEANVATICMDGPALLTLAKECPGIRTITLDVTQDWNSTRSAVESIGHIDCLVNNAGVAVLVPFLDVTQEDFDKCFNINIKALFNISQVVAKQMIKQGKGGSIVNVSSQASQVGLMEHCVYGATKAAVDSTCRGMALELGKHNIRVNCVNPTVVMTDIGRSFRDDPQKSSQMLSRIPLNRFAEVDEVVNGIMFLLSDKASMITGTTLPIDGGVLAS